MIYKSEISIKPDDYEKLKKNIVQTRQDIKDELPIKQDIKLFNYWNEVVERTDKCHAMGLDQGVSVSH